MTADPNLVVGAQARLRHALHAGGHFLPAQTAGTVVSIHRAHVRVSLSDKPTRVVVRIPTEAIVVRNAS